MIYAHRSFEIRAVITPAARACIDGSPPASPSLGLSRQEHWSGFPMFSIDFAAPNLYPPLPGTKALISPHHFFQEISLPTPLFSFLKSHTLVLSFQARNMTMRVRRPLQGTLRRKIRPYATQSKKVKTTRKPNCFPCSCARKKLNQSRKRCQNMRRDQRRRQNPKRR